MWEKLLTQIVNNFMTSRAECSYKQKQSSRKRRFFRDQLKFDQYRGTQKFYRKAESFLFFVLLNNIYNLKLEFNSDDEWISIVNVLIDQNEMSPKLICFQSFWIKLRFLFFLHIFHVFWWRWLNKIKFIGHHDSQIIIKKRKIYH